MISDACGHWFNKQMSKQADITRAKLSVIRGVLVTFKKQNAFARLDIRRAIDAGIEAIDICGQKWPAWVNKEWCAARWEIFARFIYDEAPDNCFSDQTALACMCERAMYDMLEEYGHNRGIMQLLQPIATVTAMIHTFCDRDGANYPAYDKSKYLLDRLDAILEAK